MSQYAISNPDDDSTRRTVAHAFSSWRVSRGYLISTVGTTILTNIVVLGLVVAVLPNMLSHLGVYGEQQARLTAVVLAMSTGAAAVFFPLVGVVADMAATRKWPIMAGLIIYLGATIGFYTAPSVLVFVLSRAGQGASSSLLITSVFALCLESIDPAEFGVVFGLLFGILELGATFSPPLGGSIYTRGGTRLMMFACIAMIILALTMVALMKEGKRRSRAMSKSKSHEDEIPTFEEQRPLLEEARSPGEPSHTGVKYILEPSSSILLRRVPILQCLRDKRLIGALCICLTQSSLGGAFDATLPLEANLLFELTPEQVGYLFIPFGIAKFTFSQIGGRAVDRFGPRKMGMACYLFLVPVLLMFYLLQPSPRIPQIVLLCVLLVVCGIGTSSVNTVSIVEADSVVERYRRLNPHIFGDKNPSAALCGLNMMTWSIGYTGGSLLAGNLRLAIGYGNTMAVFAGLSFLGFVSSYFCLDKKMPPNVIVPDITAS